MIFFLVYIFLFFGMILLMLGGFLPPDIPVMLKYLLFMMGFIISLLGIVILQGRATKTGACHLLEFGRPDRIIWIYAHRDGTLIITPAMREIGGQLYSPELDAQIQDFKSYRIFDHSVRIVPSGIGHAVDLDFILYASLLKTKYGFNNITEAREGAKKIENKRLAFLNPIIQKLEKKQIVSGEEIGKIT